MGQDIVSASFRPLVFKLDSCTDLYQVPYSVVIQHVYRVGEKGKGTLSKIIL